MVDVDGLQHTGAVEACAVVQLDQRRDDRREADPDGTEQLALQHRFGHPLRVVPLDEAQPFAFDHHTQQRAHGQQALRSAWQERQGVVPAHVAHDARRPRLEQERRGHGGARRAEDLQAGDGVPPDRHPCLGPQRGGLCGMQRLEGGERHRRRQAQLILGARSVVDQPVPLPALHRMTLLIDRAGLRPVQP